MKWLKRIVLIVLLLGACAAGVGYYAMGRGEQAYQRDALKKRVNDVHQIAGIFEEYRTKTGHYPLYKKLSEPTPAQEQTNAPMAVLLLQPNQQIDWYNYKFPFSIGVTLVPIKQLLADLDANLGRSISLPIDPQKVPTSTPNTYIAFFTRDGGYVVMAFSSIACTHCSRLAEHAYVYAVSSPVGDKVKSLLTTMKVDARIYLTIPKEEITAAAQDGAMADDKFGRFVPIKTAQ